MRDIFIEEIIKEVLGPKNGSNEQISGNPYNEYVTGVIIPKKCKKIDSPDVEITRETLDGENGEDESQSEELIGLSTGDLQPGLRSKTFGLSFKLRMDTNLEICCTWGEYNKEVKVFEGEEGIESRDMWIRKPYYKIINVNTAELESNKPSKWHLNEKESGSIQLFIRKIHQSNDVFLINVTIINDYSSKCQGDEIFQNSIYQPNIRIIAENPDLIANIENSKERIIDHIYQHVPVKARGHFCSVIWSDIEYGRYVNQNVLWPDGNEFKDCRKFYESTIRSEFVPFYAVSAPDLNWKHESSIPPELSAYELSESWNKDVLKKNLEPIVKCYHEWILEKKSEITEEKLREYPYNSIIKNQNICLERIKEGIERLLSDETARLAFCFANRVIYLQNEWKKEKPGNSVLNSFSWWPFQLSFFLMNIESLTDEKSSFRSYVDLLWIPTGGGKTETYMAMMAYVIALRRIRAVHYNDSHQEDKTGAGVSILTRYTLRLLTVQQFRRTLLMITAAEYLRITKTNEKIGWRPCNCTIQNNWLYGSVKFSIGLWVGGGLTPNHLRYCPPNEKSALKILKDDEKIVTGDPAQILKCPVCGAWLAIPHEGLPSGENTIFSIINCNFEIGKISDLLKQFSEKNNNICVISVDQGNLKSNNYTIAFKIKNETRLRSDHFNQIGENVSQILKSSICSFNFSRPGYFPLFGIPGEKIGEKSQNPRDFVIYCPNPSCILNHDVNYEEGKPLSNNYQDITRYPDGCTKISENLPWPYEKRMPIPAYTVDEQIYTNCPTIVISTVDKYARLAFEPRCAALFGNIDSYNVAFGYFRKTLYPKDQMKRKTPWKSEYNIQVTPFKTPELIIQDELHLLEGPLGSLYGLYETVIEGLIRERGGCPKYIASSATVNEAESHIFSIFRKKVFQFPPYGYDYQDSFFIRIPPTSQGWENEMKPGRIYGGVYAPGRGSPIPPIRIWARLLKTGYDLKNDIHIKNYWTIVGYFNAIRELGGAVSFYHQDVIEWLSHISDEIGRASCRERV